MCQKNRMINLILFAVLFVSSVLLGAEYSWTGATGDNLYTTADNWSGQGRVPKTRLFPCR